METPEKQTKKRHDTLQKRPPIITILAAFQFLRFLFLINTITDPRTQQLLQKVTLPEHYPLIRFIIGLGIFIGVASVWNLKRWGTWVFWTFATLSLLYGIIVHEPRLYMHIDNLTFGIICWYYYNGLKK